MPTAFDDLLVDEPVANANAFDDLLMDEPPKEKSFFGLGDTASALAEIPSELYQGIPIALRRMRLGLQDPSSYSPEDAAAFEAESQRQAVLQQEQEAREARGENTSVGDAFRGAVRSLPFSVSTMVPSIAAGAGTGAAVGAVFPPSELVTVPVGAIAGTAAGMLASGTAAYRMAGQQFLDDSIRGLQDKAKSEGKTLSKEELDNAYEVLLPIAENTGLWEAGPEAVGNAVTAGAGKFIFGFGKDLAADVVKRTLGKKIAAAVGATGVEVGGETITAMNQGPDQAKAQQFIETGSTEGALDEYQGLEGFGKALEEVGPTVLATQALFGGTGGGVKLGEMGLKKLIGKQNTQDPFNPEAPITEDDTSAEDLTLDEATALEPPAPVIPAPEDAGQEQESTQMDQVIADDDPISLQKQWQSLEDRAIRAIEFGATERLPAIRYEQARIARKITGETKSPEEVEKRQEAEIKEAANQKIDAVAPVITQDLVANKSPLTAVAMNRVLNDSNDAAEVQKAREAEIEAAKLIQAAQKQAAETQTQETKTNEESILLQQANDETQADVGQTADGQGQEEIIPAPTETQAAEELNPFESPLPETITANVPTATSPTDSPRTQDPFEDAPTQGEEVSTQREATVTAPSGTVAPESQQEVETSKTSLTESRVGDTGGGMEQNREASYDGETRSNFTRIPASERGDRFIVSPVTGLVFDRLYSQSVTPPAFRDVDSAVNALNQSRYNNDVSLPVSLGTDVSGSDSFTSASDIPPVIVPSSSPPESPTKPQEPSPPPTQETWERDTTKPEQMTPGERRDAKIQVIAVETEKGLKPIYYLAIREGDNIGIYGSNYSETDGELIGSAKPVDLIARPTLEEVRQVGSSVPAYIEKLAIDEGAPIYRANGVGVQAAHQAEIANARLKKAPVSKAAVDAYGITLPEGYVQDGELYVYRPSGTVEAKPEPTPKEPEYISPKEIAERFAAESERNARRQSDTVAEMEAKEAAYKPQVRQSGAELLEEYKAQQKAKPAPQPKPAAEVGTPISDPLGYGTALIALFPSLQKAGVTVIPIEEAMTRLDAEWQKKKDSGKATRLDQIVYEANKRNTQSALDGENIGGIWTRTDKTVAVSNKATPSAMAHEVGHAIMELEYANAPEATKKAIEAEYTEWFKSKYGPEGVPTVADQRRIWEWMTDADWLNPATPFPQEQRVAKWEAYRSGFNEWFADEVAKWAVTRQQPRTLVDKFFSEIAAKLQKLWDSVKSNFSPNETLASWLDSISVVSEAKKAKPAAEVGTPVAGVPAEGMQRRQQALDAGLDRRTADAVGAFTDIASMMREVQNRTPEQAKKDWLGYLEADLEKFKGSAPRTAPESSLFTEGQYVRYERQKDGGFKVIADEATWSPPGEKAKPQFKKGTVIRKFPNADALFEYVRSESTKPPSAEFGATNTVVTKIKQGDTIRFKQEGKLLSGEYLGPVNQSGKQVYEVQVAGEPRSRRVTAQSINGSNDAQLDGTKYSRQRTTRPKTQGLERKVAEEHLKKLGVPSSKVYIIDEPSIQIKGRYDPDGGIALNIAYLDSVEEINDTLMNHEAIHDAVETDKKVKQRAIELLDALTDDEMSIINEQIRGYSENEKQDERIVEAVRLMTSRRPDLRTKWARFVEAVSLAIKKFLGIKGPYLDKQVAELVAARILARGEARVLKGKMGGRDKFSGNMYAGDAVTAAKDAEYLDAVSSGDMSKAQRMVDEAAKKAGYSERTFHGSKNSGFTQFDSRFAGKGVVTSNSSGGFYFSSSQDQASWFADPISVERTGDDLSEGDVSVYGDGPFYALVGDNMSGGPFPTEDAAQKWGESIVEKWNSSDEGDVVFEDEKIMQTYLRLDNPLEVDGMSEFRAAERTAKGDGYDSIVVRDVADGPEVGDVFIVFNPEQIKSADPVTYDSSGNVIPLSQRFQPESPDIRYSRVNDSIPTHGLPDKDLIQEYAASRAARAAKEVEFEDDIDRQQVFGQQIGPERIKQTMQEAEAAAQEVFNGSEVPLTNEGLKQWMKTMDDFSVNNPESVNRVVELRNKSNSMAPTALQTELGIYTERMANATNDPTLFKTFINEVNDLVAVVGGVSDSARALVARRWSPLTERWGAAAKTLAEVKKNGPPDVDTTSDESANAANQEMTDALDEKRRALLEQDSKALAKLLSQVKGDVKWSDFFTNNSRISQKERQRRIYTQILKHDNLRNLSQAERLQLTRELDKAWARARKKVFLREFSKKIPLKNPKLKKQLAAQAPALLKAINLGTFDSQAYRKEIAQTYGLKDLSDADLVKVIKLGAEIQDTDPLSRERRKKIMQLARVISGVTNIPLSHIVSAYYISSILASGRTGMGAAFSIVEVIMESIIGATVAGTRSPTQAMAGLNAAFKAFPRGLIEGLSHFWTGDKTGTLLASDAFNQFLGGEGYSPVSLGELLWKEKNPIKKFAGAVIVASERLLTGVDLTLSSTMHEASLIWANTATDFLDENGNKISIRNPTAADKAKMMDQVIAEEFGGVKPPMTPANLATINAAMRDQTERFYINEDPQNGTELVKTARRMASGPSFQGEVRGFMGEVVDRVNALFSDAGPKFEKWAEKNNVTGAKRDFLALFVGLSALGKAFAGMSFFGFVGRLINRNLQFVPGTALIPEIVLGTNPTQYEKKAMFAKNAVGFGLIILALQYILGDDDEDDNMFGLEGSGDTLSGDQRNAKRTTKALPNSIWYRDQNGEKVYLSFANSSLSWVISAMANLREQKVNNPEKWAEATTEAKLAGGMFEAGKSILSTSAMGRLGELLGGGRAYSTGGVGAGVEGMASKIASFGGGFVPSVIREIDYLLDPNYYEPRTLAERAVSVIPFLRRQVADGQGSMGVFGSNAQINRSPTSRIYSSGADTEAEKILSKMQDEGLYLPLPDDKKGQDIVSMTGRKIVMTPEQTRRYVQLTGEDYQRWILREGESIIAMPRDKAKKRITEMAGIIKKRAAKMALGSRE